jgi:hypothetical protein
MSEEVTGSAKGNTEAFNAIHDIAAILQLKDGLDPDVAKGLELIVALSRYQFNVLSIPDNEWIARLKQQEEGR